MKLEGFSVGMMGANCYLLISGQGRAVLVDPGDEGEKIVRLLRSRGVEPGYLLLTHGHFDHVSGVAAVKEAFPQAQVLLHPDDLPFLEQPEACYSSLGEVARRFSPPRQVDGFLSGGQELSLDDIRLKVLHTPGHSPGSVTFQGEDFLLTGDTLFAGGIGRCDLYGGSLEKIERSLAGLAALKGDWRVYPGHGPSTTLDRERRENPYLSNVGC